MFNLKKSLLTLAGVIVLAGGIAALLPPVGFGQDGSKPLKRDPRRSFYLTRTFHNGSQALSGCATGYHMASLGEIHDTTSLRYETELGLTADDSGFGPPADRLGWIRTGHSANVSDVSGRANCNVWASPSAVDRGTAVSFTSSWNDPSIEISPWRLTIAACSIDSMRVWCVQD